MASSPDTSIAEQENPFVARLQETENGAAPRTKPKTGILSQITTRKRRRPVFGVVYGPPGIGKSTFGSTLPNPVFIQAERIDQISGSARLPVPKDFKQLYDQVDALDKEAHDYQSIIVDTLDAVEELIRKRVCEEGKVRSIEQYEGGFGKGWSRSREIFTGLLKQLSDMSERFNVLLLAHSHLKTISDPMLSAPYDLHKPKLHEKNAEVLMQIVDLVCFANLDVSVTKESPKARKGRAIISDDRLMWTQPTTGIMAKNRFDLDSPIPFTWETLEQGINNFYER